MSLLDTEAAYQAANQFDESYKLVTFRHLVTIAGPNPALNPFTGTVTVGTSITAGSTAITLNAPTVGNYFLEVGDSLVVGSSSIASVVQARCSGAAGKFTGVQVLPGVTTTSSAGAAVVITFTNDYSVEASVSAYPAALIDGTVVNMKDLRVFTKITDTSARTLPEPQPTDKLLIDGVVRTIGVVLPHYVGSNQIMWEVQGKS